jgi:2'-5' RNA ligase
MTSDTPNNTVAQVYDQLWDEASARFAAGAPQLDRHLLCRAADQRNGITLIARPSADVLEQIGELAAELRALEPEQYFYRPDELHITVLTLVSASESFQLERAPLARYHAALGELFGRARPFRIRFRGVTASPSAVLIQGYVDDDYLNQLRQAIRRELGRVGLADSLDTRYRIVTAHATIMRLRAQPRDLAKLARLVGAARERDFGSARIDRIEFVANDWYMAHDRVKLLACYSLQPTMESV